MKNQLFIVLVLFLIFFSCNNRVIARFEITNNTGIKIDSLKIEPKVITDGIYISLNP